MLRAACLARSAARCTTLLTVTATVTNSSRASRLLPSAIVRVCTGGVKYQFTSRLADDGREHGGPEPADDRDRDDRDQVDQQVIAEIQVQAGGRQAQRQQRQAADQQHPGQHAARAEDAGQVGDPARLARGRRSSRLRARGLTVGGYISQSTV